MTQRKRKKSIEDTYPDIVADVRCNFTALIDKINKLPIEPDGCINWVGPHHRQGYGFVGAYRIATEKRLMHTVHRLLLKAKMNSDLAGLDAVSTCGNMRCCNIDHYRVGTHEDVMQGVMKRRAEHPDRYPQPKRKIGPRNQKYRWGLQNIIDVKARRITIPEFAARLNISIKEAANAVYGIRDPNNYKWAYAMIRQEKK